MESTMTVKLNILHICVGRNRRRGETNEECEEKEEREGRDQEQVAMGFKQIAGKEGRRREEEKLKKSSSEKVTR